MAFQYLDDTIQQHGLPLAGVPLDPEQSAFRVVTSSLKIGVAKDPAIRVLQKAAFGLLDAGFIVARIGEAQMANELLEMRCRLPDRWRRGWRPGLAGVTLVTELKTVP